MTDQCKHCDLRGNYEKCIRADCFHHENWIAVERIKRIKDLEEALEQIGALSCFCNSYRCINDKTITGNKEAI